VRFHQQTDCPLGRWQFDSGAPPNASEIFPVKWFSSKQSLTNPKQFFKQFGIPPVKLFPWIVSSISLKRLHNLGGSAPHETIVKEKSISKKRAIFTKNFWDFPNKMVVEERNNL